MSKAGNMIAKRATKPRLQVSALGDESALYRRIRDLVIAARQTVARGVDLVQVHTSFEIGRYIVEYEQRGESRAGYGKEVIKGLAERLTSEFGQGFSLSTLKLMRQFFLQFQDRAAKISQTPPGQSGRSKSQTVSGQLLAAGKLQTASAKSQARPFSLSWSHYVFLLGIRNPDERSFYEIEAASQDWPLRELKRQFDTSLYERLALSRDKKGIRRLAKKGQLVEKPQDILKEPLVLEFLGLDEQARYSESATRAEPAGFAGSGASWEGMGTLPGFPSTNDGAIISQIERFLLEMGKGFLFEARQKRFSFDDDHFFVDLVFYNRLLRCYVLVDLKLGKLTHQDLGQMQMYVNYFDRHVRTQGENRTVGIVLCTKKNQALVTITLPKGSRIHAREYQLYLPSKEVLQKKLAEWAGKAADA